MKENIIIAVFFKFEEGFAIYDGAIKFHFVFDELKKVEVVKK